MKPTTPEFAARLQSGHTNLVRLFTLKLSSTFSLYFTDGATDVYYAGQTYKADPGVEVSAIRETLNVGYGDATITTPNDLNGVTEDMVRYNLIADASFTIERIFYDATNLGTIFDFGGLINAADITDRGLITLTVDGAGAESAGIQLAEVYSERCRNVFGDFRCGVDLEKLSVPFTVTAIDSTGGFYMSIDPPTALPGTEVSYSSITTNYDEGGTYQYVVQNNVDTVTVHLEGGGGPAWSDLSGYTPNPAATGSSFLGLTAGPGGAASPYTRGTPGTAAGGDLNTPGGGPPGQSVVRYPNGAPPPGVAPGGAGGLVVKTYTAGPAGSGKALTWGQSITVTVGRSTYYPASGNVPPQPATDPVKVFVTARTKIEELDTGFNFGSIKWLDGKNAGRVHEIKAIALERVTIGANVYFPIKVGDKGKFRPGCSNYRTSCKKYNNIKNYRGEPDVPQITGVPPDDPNKPKVNFDSNLTMGFPPRAG